MSGRIALLVGLLVVPVVLLWLGSRVRHAEPGERGFFWGAVTGQVLSMVVGAWAAMAPAVMWSAADRFRGLLALWGYVLFPVVCGVIGYIRGRRRITTVQAGPTRGR